MFKSRHQPQRSSLSPQASNNNVIANNRGPKTSNKREDSQVSLTQEVDTSQSLMKVKYSPLLATQNPQIKGKIPADNLNQGNIKRLPSAAPQKQGGLPMVYDTQKMVQQNFIYNDKFSHTTAAQTSSSNGKGQSNMNNGSSNFMFSNSSQNTTVIMSQTAASTQKLAQRKMIMRISKSPYKHQSSGQVEQQQVQRPQEFIMNLMKNQKQQQHLQSNIKPLALNQGSSSNWVLESNSKKIVMKQSPERKRIVKQQSQQFEDGEEEIDEDEYQMMKRDIEEMRQQELQASDEEDSYDQLEVDEPFEREESQKSPKKALQLYLPEKKSNSSQQSAEDKDSQYSPHKVVAAMMAKKDRKIPNSVLKPHADQVILILSSTFTINPQYRVFFPYPKYCQRGDQAPSFLVVENRLVETQTLKICQVSQADMKKQHMTLGFKMTETTHVYNSVVNSLKNSGHRIVAPNSSKWNVMWTGVTKPENLQNMCKYQRVNHFPQSFHLGRKDLMWKNIQRMKRIHPVDYDICPTTYLLPEDSKKLMFDREADPKSLYIMKPNASSCGKGIAVLGPTDPLPKKGGYLISKYVSNPHLIDGLKYDLRIYVLVTSFDPLKVYLFKEGLTRFATEKYSTNLASLKKRFVHLTNYSVNKKNLEGYVRNQDKGTGGMQSNSGAEESQERSSKWNLLQLKKQMEKMGIDYNQVKGRIKDVIIKTLISVEPHIVNSLSRSTKYRQLCFEVYGFDILLDNKLKPWLLEVNISPSLSSSSPLDKKIKTMLICDTLNLVGVSAYDRKKFQKDQEILIRKRLLGLLDKSPRNAKDEINGNIQKILKSLGQQATDDDVQIVSDFEEEQLRRGNFELIYPMTQNVNYYSQFFENNRYANEILWKYLRVSGSTSHQK